MFICLSPGGQSITQGETPKEKLLVGTVDGIFAFQKRNGSWEGQGTMVPGKHFSSIIFEPVTQTLFGGTYSGEIYASADRGQTWERRDNGIDDKEIYSLATQVVDGKPRLYAGTQPAHLFYSDDLGKSWTELPGLRQVPGVEKWTFPGPPHLAHAKSITFHPKDPNIIHVAVEVGGFLKSTDGGKTWSTIDNINPDAHRVLIPTNDPSKLYGTAPTTNCGPETAAGFCVSEDGGDELEKHDAERFPHRLRRPILRPSLGSESFIRCRRQDRPRHLAQTAHRRRAHRAQPGRRQDLGYSHRRLAGTHSRQH